MAVFAFFAIGAVALDFKLERIPNIWLFLFASAAMPFLKDAGPVVHGVAALVFGYWVWMMGGWGAGDGKFFACLVLWAGVLGMPYWFGIALFLSTASLLALAWLFKSFKSSDEKYVRRPGTPFMLAAFAAVWTVYVVDKIAGTIQH